MKKALFMVFMLLFFFSALPCQAVEKGPEPLALELTQKGWRYFNIGEIDTALKRFRQAVILDPDFAPGYYGVGYIYSLQKRHSLAIQYYRKAIALADPPDTHAYANLGLALMMIGQKQEGLQVVQKALEIDPDNGEAHISLANYYCAEKDGTLARVHLEKAKAIGVQPDARLIEEMKVECP